MASVYHNQSRTRANTWVPRRVYYVLRFLQRQLTPGKAHAISNKQIQTAIKFGSEGEVSQIMRWLAGELPLTGRWAYGALDANPQRYRFIDRERMPNGGYLITLLASPRPIDPPALARPQVVQLSFLSENDPSVIPLEPQQDAPQGGSFFHDPSGAADPAQQHAANHRSARDQHEETPKTQNQEEESARAPLFDRLMAEPGMSRSLAERIAQSPIGTLAEFEADLRIAQTFARSPFYFTVSRWRDGQRVAAPEEPHHDYPARSAAPARTRRRSRTNRPAPTADSPSQDDYAALIAEWERTEPLGPIAMRVPGQRSALDGD